MQTHGQIRPISQAPPASRLGDGRATLARKRLRRIGLPYLFLSPFLLLFGAFFVLPLAYALGLSLFSERMIGGTIFVGAQNYVQVLQDGAFWEGVRRMALFGVVQVPLGLALALAFALVLDSRLLRMRTPFRLGYFLPYAIPSVVATLLWGYLYGPSFGLFAQVAALVHLPPPGFFTAGGMLPALGNIVTWQYTGSNMIILYAALQSIPPDLYDAATMDGATGWQIARHVKVPLIAPALILTGIFGIIGTLQLFSEPQLMASFAPDVIGDHYTPNLYAYTAAFTNQQYNYSAAIAFTLGVLIFACSAVFLFVVQRRGG